MSNQQQYVVSKKWLLARLYEPDLVIVDCRFQLGKPASGQEAYTESHIPRAVYVDLERDLSAPIGEHGGRHPLPDVETLAERLGRAGISRESRVVAYDDQGGAMASRLWWVLRYLGHEQAYVLEEGFSAWVRDGYPTTAEQPVVIPTTFAASPRTVMLVGVERVREVVARGGAVLIDSRDPERYRGEVEPLDRKAGHIPGAINRVWSAGRREDGTWKSPEEQRARFAELPQDGEIIVYCGSGVTATPNVLALQEAGFTNVKLYGGSWSDWISYSENPIATGEE
ncbi:sulfurtransferase [Cohnella nanjingensis]|uniref:Sulfurtransferase n=1 Tax=Cohnella nanjingensis TaxID=1387779 RepID=A0A7X0RMQ9_9BACL|nr:sulfurtransferase [Cohnella nanjingensis]MBB6670325.1 sulfurtransferase [Cohnella nanjingensis]